MMTVKLFLKALLLITLMYALDSLPVYVETLVRHYTIICKFLVCLLINKLLWESIGRTILHCKIDHRRKAVIITGCDSGFGFLTAKRLHSRGFTVFAGCLSPTEGGALELEKTYSDKLRILQLDVTKNDNVLKAKDFVQENLGDAELWAVVNNAGIFRGGNAEICPLEDFQGVFDVNVMGQVRVSKAFLPLLRKSKGRLININSLAGRLASSSLMAYSMSKYAAVCSRSVFRSTWTSLAFRLSRLNLIYFEQL